MDAPTAPRGTRRGAILAALADIKLAHTVFALPFAILGACLALEPERPDAARLTGQLALVVACMFFARTWAMLVNRLADARFDADNPRTAGRAIPSGRLVRRDALTITAASALAFCACCAGFLLFGNAWPVVLSVPTLAWIAFYSFTKRFTAWCHVFLGGALAFSPLAAAIALRPEALADTPTLWWLAGMVLAWVAGFDVIYALQDLAFDRTRGLRSVPAALGWQRAAYLSRAMHVAAAAALVLAWQSDDRLGSLFAAGVAITLTLLAAEHIVLAKRGERGLSMAFFTLNGIVSCVLGAAGVADLLL